MFEYEHDVVHSARVERQAANALSCLATAGANITALEDDIILKAGQKTIAGDPTVHSSTHTYVKRHL